MTRMNKAKFRVLHSKAPMGKPRGGNRMSGAERRLNKRRELRAEGRWVAGFVLSPEAPVATPAPAPPPDSHTAQKALGFCAVASLVVLALMSHDAATKSLFAALAVTIAALVAILFSEEAGE